MNYFFWNRRLKRLLVLQLKCQNPMQGGEYLEDPLSQRSVTPI